MKTSYDLTEPFYRGIYSVILAGSLFGLGSVSCTKLNDLNGMAAFQANKKSLALADGNGQGALVDQNQTSKPSSTSPSSVPTGLVANIDLDSQIAQLQTISVAYLSKMDSINHQAEFGIVSDENGQLTQTLLFASALINSMNPTELPFYLMHKQQNNNTVSPEMMGQLKQILGSLTDGNSLPPNDTMTNQVQANTQGQETPLDPEVKVMMEGFRGLSKIIMTRPVESNARYYSTVQPQSIIDTNKDMYQHFDDQGRVLPPDYMGELFTPQQIPDVSGSHNDNKHNKRGLDRNTNKDDKLSQLIASVPDYSGLIIQAGISLTPVDPTLILNSLNVGQYNLFHSPMFFTNLKSASINDPVALLNENYLVAVGVIMLRVKLFKMHQPPKQMIDAHGEIQ